MRIFLRVCITMVVLVGNAFGDGLDGLRIEPDIVYGHKAGLALTFDAYRPALPNGAAVLFINSGGFLSPDFSRQCVAADGEIWSAGATTWRFREPEEIEPELLRQVSFEKLLAAGFTVFDVRHGSSPYFELDEIVVDCRGALKTIRRDAVNFGIDPERFGVWGCSAGGYLAAYLALAVEANDPDLDGSLTPISGAVQAAVLYYPAGYDLNEFPFLLDNLPALDLPAEELDRLSLKHHVTPQAPPTLVVWGDADRDFITKPADEIHTALQDLGNVTSRIVYPAIGHIWNDAQGHYDAATGEDALVATVDWFMEHLLTVDSEN